MVVGLDPVDAVLLDVDPGVGGVDHRVEGRGADQADTKKGLALQQLEQRALVIGEPVRRAAEVLEQELDILSEGELRAVGQDDVDEGVIVGLDAVAGEHRVVGDRVGFFVTVAVGQFGVAVKGTDIGVATVDLLFDVFGEGRNGPDAQPHECRGREKTATEAGGLGGGGSADHHETPCRIGRRGVPRCGHTAGIAKLMQSLAAGRPTPPIVAVGLLAPVFSGVSCRAKAA